MLFPSENIIIMHMNIKDSIGSVDCDIITKREFFKFDSQIYSSK